MSNKKVNYIFFSPQGQIVKLELLYPYCKENKLSVSEMKLLHDGWVNEYKGYRRAQ
jgi:hypothetical protein